MDDDYGYFNDITRIFLVGQQEAKGKEIFDMIQEAANTPKGLPGLANLAGPRYWR